MALVSELTEVTAKALGYPLPTVRLFARRLREAGLLSEAGRGRGAAQATPLDAARLLIALLATQSPSRAAGCVVDFGGLALYDRRESAKMNLTPDIYGLPESHTFEQAVGAIIAGFAQEGFGKAYRAAAASHPRRPGGYSPPVVHVEVWETLLMGFIQIEATRDNYNFAPLVACGDKAVPEKVTRAYMAAVKKYRRAIHSTRSVELQTLKTIAAVVNGSDPLPDVQDILEGKL
jgi:hypothetical protein